MSLVAILLNYTPPPSLIKEKPVRKSIQERGREKTFAIMLKIKHALADGELSTIQLCHAIGWTVACSSNLKRIARKYPQLQVSEKRYNQQTRHYELFWIWKEEDENPS